MLVIRVNLRLANVVVWLVVDGSPTLLLPLKAWHETVVGSAIASVVATDAAMSCLLMFKVPGTSISVFDVKVSWSISNWRIAVPAVAAETRESMVRSCMVGAECDGIIWGWCSLGKDFKAFGMFGYFELLVCGSVSLFILSLSCIP
jgi:hypothetical protein